VSIDSTIKGTVFDPDTPVVPAAKTAANPFSVAVFATVGTHVLFHDLLSSIFSLIPDADPPRVAEETLSLLAVIGARAVEEGAAGLSTARPIADSLLNVPFAFRDYTLGSQMLLETGMLATEDQPVEDIQRQSVQIGERLDRIRAFYEQQFPSGTSIRLPHLQDKLLLWMGRISPPGLETTPADRVTASRAPQLLARHARLVAAYVRHAVSAQGPGSLPGTA